MLNKILAHLAGRPVPQSAPLTPTQVPNSAGGYVFEVSAWDRLDRFLILGTDGGTYYVSERTLTLHNARVVEELLAVDGPRIVRRIVELRDSNRLPRLGPAIFALALAMKRGDLETRRAAADAVPAIARTHTQLFQLATAVQAFGGWGRATKRAFARWYTDQDAAKVAYQAVKYQHREGWSGRDVLRKAHPTPPTEDHDQVFRWMAKGWEGALPSEPPTDAMRLIWAMERAKRTQDVDEMVALILNEGLVRELVPTRFLREASVWEALLHAGRGMPMTALLRNLAKMTSVGLIAPMSDASLHIASRLSDARSLQRARIHPIAVLSAMRTYARGSGVRGKLSWTPVQVIKDALDRAFPLSFGSVKASGKRTVVALDVSGSMGCGSVAGLIGLTPREAAAAMAVVTLRTEPHTYPVAFTHGLTPFDIGRRASVDSVVRKMGRQPFGATDCALPMLHARKRKLQVDTFVVYTDNETWHGGVHPCQALRDYRQAMGIPAKLIVVGMTATNFTIADPADSGMLDVVGFDTAAPNLMAEFARR